MESARLVELAQEFGAPLFVYNAEVMKRQYKRLTNAFSGVDLHLHYACKALSNQAVLKLFRSLGAGLDTVSIEEVKLGMMAGFRPDQIMYTPNGVSFEEIKQAVNLGVHINIDNLSMLEKFGHEYGDRYPVCVRINPHIMAGGHHQISVGHIDSKFGISIHQTRHLKRIVDACKLRINGLHMHTGSDILDVDVFLNGARILMDVAMDFDHLEYLDFGSGFKVAYKPDEASTNVEELGTKMSDLFQTFCTSYGRELKLVFEPGKYLVSEAGYFLTSVNVIKQTTATVFAQINSGFNHFIRPMFYDSYHHITNISNPNGQPRIYTVTGYICETDTFGWDRSIAEIHEKDILCFANAGAYVYSMSSNYNSRVKPAEVLLVNGKPHLISRRQNLEDLLAAQIGIGNLFETERETA